MTYLDRLILTTFNDEENTIFHVENWLIHKGVSITRKEIKERLNVLLELDYLKIHEAPFDGKISFLESRYEFEEDYWFMLTEKGKKILNK